MRRWEMGETARVAHGVLHEGESGVRWNGPGCVGDARGGVNEEVLRCCDRRVFFCEGKVQG